jgi:hypothetical protein
MSARKIKNKPDKNIPFRAGSFNAPKVLGYTLIAAAMLSLASCNKKNATMTVTTEEKAQTTADAQIRQTTKEPEEEKQAVKSYHYDPTDEPLRAEDYRWSETIYPDGRIERDSLGYKIFITADGKRTSIHTETDDAGNTTITTLYPDSAKCVHIDYKTDNPDEIMYTETKYRSNGSVEERTYYNKAIIEDSTNIPQTRIETSIHKYNDKDILLMWNSNVTDSVHSESNNEYDKKGRLIYDDIKQERYEYRGDSKHPFRSVSECDSCRRIKIYNSDGTTNKDYFKAADGTITQAADSIM